MNAYEVVITPDAEADLRQIRDYIAYGIDARKIALAQVRAIRQAMEGLRTFPARNRLMDEEPWKSRGIRRLLVRNYFIYYRIDEGAGRVYVLNVIFARRDQVRAITQHRTDR